MKFTLSWLKEHLDTKASLEDITDKLTAIGLELESVEDPSAIYGEFKTAYVEKAEQHPDADRLRVCIVDTGTEKLQVVCGAPNARTGMISIFAPSGSYIPGTDIHLQKSKIRGQESNGMLVSEREMGLSDDHEGIIDLPEDTKIGVPFTEIFDLNDPVIDIAITPNRGDCTGVRGVARDLAAAGLGTLQPLPKITHKSSYKSSVDVLIETPETNPQFVGQMIKGVKNGPSPDWLQKRLKAIGLRPISTLVDITNFMTVAYGRPLHVYDVAKLQGNISVRLSQKGESFDALNDKSYTLEDGMTAICDDRGLIGLGGIVGGTSTGCDETTKDVFVESAYFDPLSIARTGRKLQIESDARYRFERTIDPAFLIDGIKIAADMIIDLCGGEASELVIAGEEPEWERSYAYTPDLVNKMAGFDIAEKDQKAILENLGFEAQSKGKEWSVNPPSWRSDILGKADIVEEILRIQGYDTIPAVSVQSDHAVPEPAETLSFAKARQARSALCVRGMHESVTWSFMSKDRAAQFGSNDNENLTLGNPISSEWDQMRPSLLPNLIEAAKRNADNGMPNTALFEVGPAFLSQKTDGQIQVASGVRHAAQNARHWSSADTHRSIDIYDVKADALSVLESCGGPAETAQVTRDCPSHYHPGRSGTIRLGKNILAYFGEIHPAILEDIDVKGPVCGFEVFLDNIPEPRKKTHAKTLLQTSSYPAVERDFAFIVEESIEVDALVRAIKSADKNLITAVSIFDVYQGNGVEDGKKSIALAVTLQPKDHTLTDSEIEGVSKKIIDEVQKKTRGSLRN